MRLGNNIDCGFTLAEVLITLGIIGVVAAITLPAVINEARNKELEVQFKKVYSELNQIAMLFKNEKGISMSEWVNENDVFGSSQGNASKFVPLIMQYYNGNRKFDDVVFSSTDDEGNARSIKYDIFTMNGTKLRIGPCDDSGFYYDVGGRIFSFVGDGVASGDDGPVVCVDINGIKKPNKYGYDLHIFYFTTDGYVLPMGQPHKNNPTSTTVQDGTSNNFFVTGPNYCKSSSSVTNQAACAYYALQDKNPQGEGNYWQEFLGSNR